MRGRDQLTVGVSLRWFPVRELRGGKKRCLCQYMRCFFRMECAYANTCVLRYHAVAGSPQGSKKFSSQRKQLGLVQVSGRNGKKD